MDNPEPILTLLIVVLTTIISIRAFKHHSLRNKLIFAPHPILAGRQYYRLLTSALIHADGQHLFFNMLSLYMFSNQLEPLLGRWHLLLIYVAGIVGGGLLSLFLHRHHEYQALGASGGVCGIIFASIFLLPGGTISSMILPLPIPSWLYAILFLAAEFKGLRNSHSNIGHDAHIGGAIIGLLVTTAMYPYIIWFSPWTYAAVMTLSLAILIYLWLNPLHLPLKSFWGKGAEVVVVKKPAPQPEVHEVDAILEKISASGLRSLTEKERLLLKRASKQ